jgi:hypothetical protein
LLRLISSSILGLESLILLDGRMWLEAMETAWGGRGVIMLMLSRRDVADIKDLYPYYDYGVAVVEGTPIPKLLPEGFGPWEGHSHITIGVFSSPEDAEEALPAVCALWDRVKWSTPDSWAEIPIQLSTRIISERGVKWYLEFPEVDDCFSVAVRQVQRLAVDHGACQEKSSDWIHISLGTFEA